MYPPAQFEVMKEALLLRNALVPYLYTAARNAYDDAVAAVHPLYYDWPELDAAYKYDSAQYLLGEDFLAAPITSSSTNRSERTGCLAQDYLGCVDAHWGNHGLFATDLGNFDSLTLSLCASKCASLSYKVSQRNTSHL